MDSQKIKEWLERSGFSQRKIAKDLGISPVAITLAIHNKSTISRVVKWLLDHGCPEEYLGKKDEPR